MPDKLALRVSCRSSVSQADVTSALINRFHRLHGTSLRPQLHLIVDGPSSTLSRRALPESGPSGIADTHRAQTTSRAGEPQSELKCRLPGRSIGKAGQSLGLACPGTSPKRSRVLQSVAMINCERFRSALSFPRLAIRFGEAKR